MLYFSTDDGQWLQVQKRRASSVTGGMCNAFVPQVLAEECCRRFFLHPLSSKRGSLRMAFIVDFVSVAMWCFFPL